MAAIFWSPGQNMAAVFGPDEMCQLYFARTKYGKGDQIRQPYSAIFGPPGRNMAAVFCPDQIRQPYSVRGDRIWQDRIFPDSTTSQVIFVAFSEIYSVPFLNLAKRLHFKKSNTFLGYKLASPSMMAAVNTSG